MDDEEFNKTKEQAICRLGDLYADQRSFETNPLWILCLHTVVRRVADIQKLMIDVRPFFNNIPKAKTAKIGRNFESSNHAV